MEPTIIKVLAGLREARQKFAESAMDYPKAEPFEHGLQAGTYRGLGIAVDLIEDVIRDAQEEEARR